MFPALAALADLGLVFVLERDDFVAYDVAHLLDDRLHAVVHSSSHAGHARLLAQCCFPCSVNVSGHCCRGTPFEAVEFPSRTLRARSMSAQTAVNPPSTTWLEPLT